jgi:type IV pilus assembly protein PilV
MINPIAVHSVQERHPRRSLAQGFTLVEVMVALIVIAIGTLGIAKMQALALSNTGASRTRALAAIEASSLASAMHVNRAYWAAYNSTPGTIQVATTGGNGTVTSNSATLQTALTTVAGTQCTTGSTFNTKLSCYCASASSSPCTTYINMAASDLYDWSSGLASLLPAATATVTCNNGDSPVDCTITIAWTENAVASNKQQSAAATVVQYILYVVP